MLHPVMSRLLSFSQEVILINLMMLASARKSDAEMWSRNEGQIQCEQFFQHRVNLLRKYKNGLTTNAFIPVTKDQTDLYTLVKGLELCGSSKNILVVTDFDVAPSHHDGRCDGANLTTSTFHKESSLSCL